MAKEIREDPETRHLRAWFTVAEYISSKCVTYSRSVIHDLQQLWVYPETLLSEPRGETSYFKILRLDR
jgi:hypothetical protein